MGKRAFLDCYSRKTSENFGGDSHYQCASSILSVLSVGQSFYKGKKCKFSNNCFVFEFVHFFFLKLL